MSCRVASYWLLQAGFLTRPLESYRCVVRYLLQVLWWSGGWEGANGQILGFYHCYIGRRVNVRSCGGESLVVQVGVGFLHGLCARWRRPILILWFVADFGRMPANGQLLAFWHV